MPIKLPPLPFELDALEPHISKKTMEFHYGKHHATYVKTLNKLIADTDYDKMSLEKIIVESAGKEGVEQKIFNNAAQAWNHTFFWNCLTEKKTKPSESFLELIKRDFGTHEHFLEMFHKKSVDHFGSGWVWLMKDADDHLTIESMPNANNPLIEGLSPLLTCDVWEHAYYLDYQNERAKFVDAFSKIINWEFVETCFQERDNDTDLIFRTLHSPQNPQ